jgi:hypothetical protein
VSPKTARQWQFYYVEKIRASKKNRTLPAEHEWADDIWIMTVDGTHGWINQSKA